MRIWKLIAATALAALCLLPLAGSASAARGMQVGLQDDGVFHSAYYNLNKAYQQTRALNATWIRANVVWADVGGASSFSKKKPKKVKYNFGAYDRLWFYANKHNVQVQFALTGPVPAWASSKHRKGVYNPSPGAFKDFARQLAEHFRGRVTRYSVWNEPNFYSWLQPVKRGPTIYRSLYVAAYGAIKAADPSAKVLIGETSPYGERRGLALSPLKFLKGVLCSGRCKLKTDGYAQHPYDFLHSPTYKYPGRDNVTIGTLSRLTGALSGYYRRGALRTPEGGLPFIYLTEYGYLTPRRGYPSEKKRAGYLVKAFEIAKRNPRVVEMVQYTLVPPRQRRYKFFDLSIVKSNGRPLKSYNDLVKWARGAARSGAIASAR